MRAGGHRTDPVERDGFRSGGSRLRGTDPETDERAETDPAGRRPGKTLSTTGNHRAWTYLEGDRRGRPTMMRLSAGAPVGECARRSSRAPSLDPATPRFPIRSVVGLWNSEAAECPSESADRERERDRGRGEACSGGCPFPRTMRLTSPRARLAPPFHSSHSAPVAWVTPMLA
jgi:hypothetical protein